MLSRYLPKSIPLQTPHQTHAASVLKRFLVDSVKSTFDFLTAHLKGQHPLFFRDPWGPSK